MTQKAFHISEQDAAQTHLNQNLTSKFNNPLGHSNSGEGAGEPKPHSLTENMKVFYKELVEITLDFMANNMFFDSASQRQVTAAARGQSRFVVDAAGKSKGPRQLSPWPSRWAPSVS